MVTTTGQGRALGLLRTRGTGAMITASNHVLERSAWATERLAVFAGANVRVVAGPLDLRVGIDRHGHLCAPDDVAPPEVTLSLPTSELPTLLAGGYARLANVVRIEGNAELADTLGFVFRHIEWDVEEDLSRVLGDIPARRVSLAAQALRSTHDQVWEALKGNTAEYLIEEQRLLVTHVEQQEFAADLVPVRDALARLEKRLGKLRAHKREGA